MKPNSYYRMPDFKVGGVDQKGRFSRSTYNQVMAETWFHEQRLNDAHQELRSRPFAECTAIRV